MRRSPLLASALPALASVTGIATAADAWSAVFGVVVTLIVGGLGWGVARIATKRPTHMAANDNVPCTPAGFDWAPITDQERVRSLLLR